MENGASYMIRSEASKVPNRGRIRLCVNARLMDYPADITMLLIFSYIVNIREIHRHSEGITKRTKVIFPYLDLGGRLGWTGWAPRLKNLPRSI
jgi:hypothetical protein